MKPIIALTNFNTVLPSLEIDQKSTLDLIAKIHSDQPGGDRVPKLIGRYGVKPTQISKRLLEDIELIQSDADINERTVFFGDRAREVFSKFYPKSSTPPSHIIHVTCTGYISPSPPQHLVNENDWALQSKVTHAYHMGCYASIPAVRMAEGFVAAKELVADIVHTEMCGLHMDRNDHSPEQLVVQSLFADGHIKYSAVPADQASSGFRVLQINEQIVKDSHADMSWVPSSWGMKMTLSREVPSKIGSHLRDFIKRLATDSGCDFSDILTNGVFAVHPGGPKIIDSVANILELSDEQVAASREILFERGNMSSATLPHVWQRLLDNKIPSGKKVVSLAFGPGLTIFGALFDVV